jgi:hypothetical protein
LLVRVTAQVSVLKHVKLLATLFGGFPYVERLFGNSTPQGSLLAHALAKASLEFGQRLGELQIHLVSRASALCCETSAMSHGLSSQTLNLKY